MKAFTEETATVYRALNGRRYLTKRGAAFASAKALIRERYGCNCMEPERNWEGAPISHGYTCDLHDMDSKLVHRLVRFWMHLDRRSARRRAA